MRNALVIVALVLVAVLMVWGGVHVVSRPINPAQAVPKGHFGGACWTCHFVSDSASIVED